MHCHKVEGTLAAGIFEGFNLDCDSGRDTETVTWKVLETLLMLPCDTFTILIGDLFLQVFRTKPDKMRWDNNRDQTRLLPEAAFKRHVILRLYEAGDRSAERVRGCGQGHQQVRRKLQCEAERGCSLYVFWNTL